MKIIRIAVDLEIPPDRIPKWDTAYIKSTRLVCTHGTSNKEYLVRIYVYPDGKFSVIGWSGKIYGTLIPHLKYLGNSISDAKNILEQLVMAKLKKLYYPAPDDKHAPGKEMSKEDLVGFLDKTISKLIYKDKNIVQEKMHTIPSKSDIKKMDKAINELIYNKKTKKEQEVSDTQEDKKEQEVSDTPEMEIPDSEREYLELLSNKKNSWHVKGV
jgi:hypothetical protein